MPAKKIVIIASVVLLPAAVILYNLLSGTDKYFKGEQLSSVRIVNPDSLGMPGSIAYSGKKLCITDSKSLYGVNKILVYNVETKKMITSFGGTGDGPGEFRSPISLNSVIGKNGVFSISDLHLLRFNTFTVGNDNKVKITKTVLLKGSLPYEIVMVNENNLFSLGLTISTDKRMAVFDTTGSVIKYAGELLPGKGKNTPPAIHNQACKGVLKVTPDGKHIVVSAQHSDYLDVYNKEGRLLHRFSGPKNFLPVYEVAGVSETPVMAIDDKKAMYGYIGIACSNEYIYALYSGNPFKGNYEGNLIHVYDMKGKFIKTYALDQKISFFTFDNDNNRFYGIQLYPRPVILEYSVNK